MSSKNLILGIDTSCDETSIAVFDLQNNRVLSNVISSQIAKHAEHGGIVPELASRMHIENFQAVFDSALREAHLGVSDISAIAVTTHPGLIGCLLVGTSFAKALAVRQNIPLYAVNHLEAHLFSPFLEREMEYPFLGLVVSGGHTAFYRVKSPQDIQLLGQTVDDAAGEAFDKGAKLMGLGYPGGPLVDRLAQKGDSSKFEFTLPRVKLGPQFLSFSGIKTAVSMHVKKIGPTLSENQTQDLCASLQKIIVDSLLDKAKMFLKQEPYKSFALSGGVAMNSELRARSVSELKDFCDQIVVVRPEFATDNGAMIAHRARFQNPVTDIFSVSTEPSKKLQARDILQALRRQDKK